MKISREEYEKLLVVPGHIKAEDFASAWETKQSAGHDLADILIERGLLNGRQIGHLIAEYKQWRFFNPRQQKVNEEVFSQVPEATARGCGVFVFDADANAVKVAMIDPEAEEIKDNLEKKFGRPLEVYLIDRAEMDNLYENYRASLAAELHALIEKSTHNQGGPEGSQVIKLVDVLLGHGYRARASDVHIEPRTEGAVVRFRIDGVMHKVGELPKHLLDPIVTRIKVLSKLRTDEHATPQDGKFRFLADNKYIDIRVSIVPVTSGENIVMRLLVSSEQITNIDNLGLSENDNQKVRAAATNRLGMILVTGPTGSGKTTTLYEILKLVNSESVHIATIEDPVEYQLGGVSQIQVNTKTGLTFAKGLRAIVRQDPDIIMVGEIRDEETADIAVNSAMTGHLVLSSLHANTAAAAIPRLIDMGVEPFLLASTIRIIVGQRLVRRLCDKCRASRNLSPEEIQLISENPKFKLAFAAVFKKEPEQATVYSGQGCDLCSHTGFSGRLGIFEILEASRSVKDLMVKKGSSDAIEEAAARDGMTNMLYDGMTKVWQGLTTIPEVLRVIK